MTRVGDPNEQWLSIGLEPPRLLSRGYTQELHSRSRLQRRQVPLFVARPAFVRVQPTHDETGAPNSHQAEAYDREPCKDAKDDSDDTEPRSLSQGEQHNPGT